MMIGACLGTWLFLALLALALCRAAAYGDAIERPVSVRARPAAATVKGGRFVRRTLDVAPASASRQREVVR